MPTLLSTATEGVAKGTEHLLTEFLRTTAGKAGAKFTLNSLITLARDNEELARKIYKLLRDSETAATFTAGMIEGVLPKIEAVGGRLGSFARVARSFGVNFVERTLATFYDEMKRLADADDFDAFLLVYQRAIDNTSTDMTQGSGEVTVVRIPGGLAIAFLSEDSVGYRAMREDIVERQSLRLVNIPKPGADFKIADIAATPGTLVQWKVTMDEALADNRILFDPNDFEALAKGFTGSATSSGKQSGFSALSREASYLVTFAVGHYFDHIRTSGRKPITTRDEWEQSYRRCREKRPFEVIASAVKTDDDGNVLNVHGSEFDPHVHPIVPPAVDWAVVEAALLMVGGHASIEMQAYQKIDNLLDHVLTDYRAARAWVGSQSDFTKKWLKDHHVVSRTRNVGLIAVVMALLSPLAWLPAMATGDFGLSIGSRFFLITLALVLTLPLVYWLKFVGSIVHWGADLLTEAGSFLGDFVKKVTGVELGRHTPQDFDGGAQTISRLGNELGGLVLWMWVLTCATIEVDALRLHVLAQGSRFTVLILMGFGVIASFHHARVKNLWLGGTAMFLRSLEMTGKVITFLLSKPLVAIVILVPLIVVGVKGGLVPDRTYGGESFVVKVDDYNVRTHGDNHTPSDLFGEAVNDIKYCKTHDTAHYFGLETPAPHMFSGNTRVRSESFVFAVEGVSSILKADYRWEQTLTAVKDATLNQWYFSLVSGEEEAVNAEFPDATVDQTHGNIVRIPPDQVEYYQANLPGSQWADYHYKADGTVKASSRTYPESSVAGKSLSVVWNWIDGKSAWAFIAFALLFAMLSTVGSRMYAPAGVVGFALSLLCVLFAILT